MGEATDAAELATLQSWVRGARDSTERQALAARGVPGEVASTLPSLLTQWRLSRGASEQRRLLLSLRALRNLCVGQPDAQDQAHQAGAAAVLAQLCDSFLDWHESEERADILEAALQALGNACVQHERNQQATWCVARSGTTQVAF